MTARSDRSSPEGLLPRTLAAALRPGPLARRLALRVILFSTAIALLITAGELTYSYLDDVRRIDGRMEQIRDAYLESITENVWVTDRERIDTQLQGIVRLPDFVLAEIRVNGRTEHRRGPGLAGRGIARVFELERVYQGRMQNIGQLVVAASYDGAYRRVLELAVITLLSNGIKTLLVALFLFGLFYQLIGRHLEKVAAYAVDQAHARAAPPLRLARPQPARPDELTALVASINHLREELVQLWRDEQERIETLREQAELLELAHDAVIVRDLDNRITFWNRGAEMTYGWSREQALGKSMHQLLQSNLPESMVNIEDTLFRAGHWEGQIGHTTKEGERIVVASRWALKRDGSGTPQAVLEINRDVTERRLIEERIERLAHTDALTQLPNRLKLDERLGQAIETAQRHEGMLAVLFVDLDEFKRVNDTLGHDAGDQLLVEVAQRLKACVRDSDIVARLGSDEFVVVLTSLKNDAVVRPTAGKVLQALAQPYALGAHQVQAGCTIGVALFPVHGEDARTLLKRADNAMYLGKTQGRGQVRFHEGD
jgi:diguanylate cyclase (GGDEF)-like protein/PAS domain S-box-containing protein